jgi:protein-tyrosine phosphatase
MIRWVIPGQLARAARPGYSGDASNVPRAEIDRWVREVKQVGVASIICLLADDQLALYSCLPGTLVEYYRTCGFSVAHLPVPDHQEPPLSVAEQLRVWAAYRELPGPVLVHCSAGIGRTGQAVEFILRELERGRPGP